MNSSQNKPILRLAFCSHRAAKYACEKWHYSKCIPAGKGEYIGVWEEGKYIGAVIFGIGAGNITKGTSYNLPPMRMVELTRVALSKHKTTVTRIISIAIKILRNNNPKLRLLVSLADPMRGHIGAIYAGGGWIYVGTTAQSKTYIGYDGKEYHERVVSITGRKKQYGKYKKCLRPQDAKEIRINSGKHKYLYPLDDKIRKRIESLRKPYPKRAGSIASDVPVIQTGEGGSTPTPALHNASQTEGGIT